MMHNRLTLALRDGAPELPAEGRIAVFQPVAGTDLSALPKPRLHLITGFLPDHRYWQQAGFETSVAPDGDYAAAVIFLPRAKALARALVETALRVTKGGLVLVDGQKTDGIESLAKAIRKRVVLQGSFAKAHGKLVWFEGGDFPDWAAQDTTLAGGFVTRPGVFSADGPDKGSVALRAALPTVLKGRVADLGAGWGYLARHVLTQDAVTGIDLIEADHAALDCARRNLSDPRSGFFWADATEFRPDSPYDVVISNPPFHTGRAGAPGLGAAFIRTAAAMLKPNGQFWMVANRHLPYEAVLEESFREIREAGGTPGFKVLHASKPRRKSR